MSELTGATAGLGVWRELQTGQDTYSVFLPLLLVLSGSEQLISLGLGCEEDPS